MDIDDWTKEVITTRWQIEQRGKRWVVVDMYSEDGDPRDVSRPLAHNAARKLRKKRRLEDFLVNRRNMKKDAADRIIRRALRHVPEPDWLSVARQHNSYYSPRSDARAENDARGQKSNVIMFPINKCRDDEANS